MSLTSSYPRVLRRVLALLVAVVLISWGTAALTRADAVENDQVCSGLDSSKIDLSGKKSSITLTAPEGQLITGYCVKAASTHNGGGPEYVTLSEPQKTVTISHSTGKGISHYSLDYGTAPETCPGGDYNGAYEGCGTPPEECPKGDHNGDADGCEAPPEVEVPGGNNPPGGNTPPGGSNPGGNTSGTVVLGAQATSGAGASSGAGSTAPSAAAGQVPTAVNAGLEPEPATTGLRSALALLMVALGLFAIGVALMPSRGGNQRHRES
ncbi:MAG TPA: hypothetical protein VFU85_04230 [Nocardioides sp.]|nr:hypothetical protein [Nocardioides sp.]